MPTHSAHRMPWRLSPVLIGLVLGVALQLQQPVLGPLAVALVLTALGVLGLLAMRWLSFAVPAGRAPAWRSMLLTLGLGLAAAVLSFGVTAWRASVFQAGALNPALEGRDILVQGRVLAMPQVGDDGVRFRLAVDSAELDGQAVQLPAQILLGWYSGFGAASSRSPFAASGPSQALSSGDEFEVALALQRQPQPLRAGEAWRMTVRLKAPHGNSNPHGFDYELWLWEQGVQASGYVRAGVNDPPPVRVSDSWRHPIERARQAVREAIFQRISDRQLAGIIAALVVGDQNAIERADWDVFRATGVAHLMSISGLHITMFAWLASAVVAWLWRRSVALNPRLCLACPAGRAGAWGGLLLALGYALFSGWGVPAQRTLCMLFTVVALRQSARQWPWQHMWLLAMAVVLALDPWALLQPGFWLSFVAVGVLFATNLGAKDQENKRATVILDTENAAPAPSLRSRCKAWLQGLAHHFWRGLREQWVVTLALAPLSALLFQQVSLVGLLANMLAIPWVTLVVTPLAMLGVLWAPAWDMAAWAAGVLAGLLGPMAQWPGATVAVAAPPLWCAATAVMGGALLVLRWPLHMRLLGLPLVLPLLLWQVPRPAPGQFELLAADIGQGNAVLVRTAQHSLLYDTGPRFSRESDAGQRVLVPLLRALDVRLDRLVLSHRDSDHVGGAQAVLAMQPQADLLSSIEATHPLQAQRPAIRCHAGQRWQWDGVQFEVLHPSRTDYDVVNKSNAMSCVLRIRAALPDTPQQPSQHSLSHPVTALLVGDIEAAQEQRLVASVPQALKADFLLMPHHGSKTSSSAEFLDAVQPRLALAQAGYRNRFNHPVPSVLARYQARGIEVVKSADCGAATWQSGQPQALQCQRQQEVRYWQHKTVVSTAVLSTAAP